MKHKKSRVIFFVISVLLVMNFAIFLILAAYNNHQINLTLTNEAVIFDSVWNAELNSKIDELTNIKNNLLEDETFYNFISENDNSNLKDKLTIFFHFHKLTYPELSTFMLLDDKEILFSTGNNGTISKFKEKIDLLKIITDNENIINVNEEESLIYHIAPFYIHKNEILYIVFEYDFDISPINNSFSTAYRYYSEDDKKIPSEIKHTVLDSSTPGDYFTGLSKIDKLAYNYNLAGHNSKALFHIIPSKNIFSNKSGYIFFFKEITPYISMQKNYVLILVISNIFFITTACLILVKTFSRYTKTINDLNLSLKEKINQQNIELSNRNAELNHMFNSTASALRVVDKNGRIIKCNEHFVRLTGKSENEIIGKLCSEIFHDPKYCHTISCPFKNTSSFDLSQEKIFVTTQHRNIFGIEKTYKVSANPIKNDNNEFIGMITEYNDITDLVEMQKTIEDNQKILKTITDTSLTCLVLANASDNNILYINPLVKELSGKDDDELIGSYWYSLFNFEKDEKLKKFLYDPSPDKNNLTTNVSLFRKSLPDVKVRLAIQILKDKDKIVLSFQDINDITNILEKQKININKAKKLHVIISPNHDTFIPIKNTPYNLFFEIFSSSCHSAGGDHCFVRHHSSDNDNGCTFFSINDQSGHEVNCILRSITTDFLYKSLIDYKLKIPFSDVVKHLNSYLIESGVFEDDEFLTSTLGFINHQDMTLEIINCAHPNFILIRGDDILVLPEEGQNRNIPLGSIENFSFSSYSLKIEPGDKILFVTDGLLEMPISMGGDKISMDNVREILGNILKGNQSLNVKEIISLLIKCISSFSGITVYNDGFNNSDDDVTILGIEVEVPEIKEEIIDSPESESLTPLIDNLTYKILNDWYSYSFTNDFALHLVLEESIINAFHHGNKNSAQPIKLRWWAENNLHIEVEDQGSGFNPSMVADPTIPANLMKDSGRGLFIMKKVADKILWFNQGKTIHIIFNANLRDNILDKLNLSMWL